MGIIFVAGSYGVGKTSICDKLSLELNVPHYSASDIISNYNNEIYKKNKIVTNLEENQNILLKVLPKLLKKNETFILSGHFCIFDKNFDIIKIPTYFFQNCPIHQILVLELNVNKIIKNLKNRDCSKYSYKNISKLKTQEKREADRVANLINAQIDLISLKYTQQDMVNLRKSIKIK